MKSIDPNLNLTEMTEDELRALYEKLRCAPLTPDMDAYDALQELMRRVDNEIELCEMELSECLLNDCPVYRFSVDDLEELASVMEFAIAGSYAGTEESADAFELSGLVHDELCRRK